VILRVLKEIVCPNEPRLACGVDVHCWRPVLREACAVSDDTNDRAGTVSAAPYQK
jgi:hypothetical protein